MEKVNKELYDFFENEINKNANDLLKEFNNSFDKIKDLPIAEKDKYLTAFAFVKNENLNKESLVSFINEKLSVLDNEKDSFHKALAKQVDAQKATIVNEQELIENKRKELEKEINILQRKLENSSDLLEEVNDRLSILKSCASKKKEEADLTLMYIKNEIEDKKEKINTYL